MNPPKPVLTFAEVINEYLTPDHALRCKTTEGIGTLAAVDAQGNVIVHFQNKDNGFDQEMFPISKITPVFRPFESLANNIKATGLIATLCHVAEGTEINPVQEIAKMMGFEIEMNEFQIQTIDNTKIIKTFGAKYLPKFITNDRYEIAFGGKPVIYFFLKLLHQNIYNVAPCIYE